MNEILELRRDAVAAWRVGVLAASPAAAVGRALEETQSLRSSLDRTLIVATGKAAVPMLRGIGPAAKGLAIVPEGVDVSGLPAAVKIRFGGHPLPTEQGLAASREVLELVSRLGARDRLLYLVSGGTSSLFEVPRESLSDDDIVDTYALLLASGMPIDEMNAVRRALSKVKGGGLARAAYPASVVTLAVSDVPDDVPADIGSGPTVASTDQPLRALELVYRHDLAAALPSRVSRALQLGIEGVDDPSVGARSETFRVVVRATEAEEAAEDFLAETGYGVSPPPLTALRGDAAEMAWKLVEPVEALARGNGKRAFVLSGETTVRLPERSGSGGRNQHLACVLAAALAEVGGFACMVGGTDGRDGNSVAAGAVVDGDTAERARRAGYDLREAIARFDSGGALKAAGDAIVTGPTGTNVADLMVVTAAGCGGGN